MKLEIELAIPWKSLNLRIKQIGKGAGVGCGEHAPEFEGKPETSVKAPN